MKHWLWNIFSSGDPKDYDLEALRKMFLLNLMMILGSFFLTLLGILEIIIGDYILASVNFSFFIILICFFLYLRKTKNYHFISLIGTTITGAFFSFLIAYGGFGNTTYMWSFTYPLIAIFLLGGRRGTVFSLIFLTAACIIFILGTIFDLFASYNVYLKFRFIPAYLTIYLLAFVMEKTREIIQRRLEDSNAALQESEKRYRLLADNVTDNIWTLDLGTMRFSYTSPSSLNIYGYDPEEAMSLGFQDVLTPSSLEHVAHILNEELAAANLTPDISKSRTFELEQYRKDGSTVWTESSVRFIYDPEMRPTSLLGVTREISERKKYEEALRKSEERYRSFVENFQGIAFKAEFENWKPVFFHGAVEGITGYTDEEFLLGAVHWQELVLPDDLKHLSGQDENRCEPAYSFDREYRIIRKDGNLRWVHEISRHVCDESGSPIEIEGTITDITRHKLVEEYNIKLENKLRHAEKMEAMGTLAGGVAHDLNNVLSGIVGYPELLLMQLPAESPLRKPITAIHESGLKASAIVSDLLSLARRGVVDYEVLNLNTIITKYLESPEYEKMKSFYPGIEIKTNLDTGLLNILGSPIHMLKVIMNLVSNSAEAIVESGEIIISTANRYVDVPISGYENIKEGNYVTLAVSDSGKGINFEDMKRMFEPFYTKKKMGKSGTGLGLAVVWGTVKDHDGYIDVHSAEGKGSTFTLYFPLTNEELTRDKGILSVADVSGHGQTILVIDDVKEQRELVSSILTSICYSVKTVSSGEAAVEYLQDSSVDLIILDMIMDPGMDGLDTYKQILKLYPRQKAVIASGYSETARVKEAQRLGAGRFIMKPYTLEKIGLIVKEEIEK
ncbi:MAG: PAS domain S-box protein [Desulfobacterales bacterium]|nr:PAS domain S-box protein [Desulfobacterales bacterium]